MDEKENSPIFNQLIQARESLKRLPILGPAIWLYGRDDHKKYTFIAEQDWLLMPPIILDQCKLYTRDEIPWAFATWAFVNDEVNARLKSGLPKIAPHEWQSGTHAWIIDIVAPFGEREIMVEDLRRNIFKGTDVNALRTHNDGKIEIIHYPAITGDTQG